MERTLNHLDGAIQVSNHYLNVIDNKDKEETENKDNGDHKHDHNHDLKGIKTGPPNPKGEKKDKK